MRMFSIHPLSLANAEFTLASAPQSHTENTHPLYVYFAYAFVIGQKRNPAHIYKVHISILSTTKKILQAKVFLKLDLAAYGGKYKA